MSKDLKHCHPQWPEERRYLKGEIEKVKAMQWSQNNGWLYYEWITNFAIMCIIILQVTNTLHPSKGVRTALKFTYLLELFLLWVRLLRPMKSVPAMSSLIVMLGMTFLNNNFKETLSFTISFFVFKAAFIIIC